MIMFTGLLSWEYHDLHSLASIQRPGARFSTPPVIYGPINLSGPLSRNFIGPKVAFLEAPVNFPGTYRARKKWRAVTRLLHGHFTVVRRRRKTSWNENENECEPGKIVLLRQPLCFHLLKCCLPVTLRELACSRKFTGNIPGKLSGATKLEDPRKTR